MSFFDDFFNYPPWPIHPDSLRPFYPGNTVLDYAMREKLAAWNLHRTYDRRTEVPLKQYSSPYAPLRVELYLGHTSAGMRYMSSRIHAARDSRTGDLLTSTVDRYHPISENADERELFIVARRLYLDAFLHEADECFQWEGKHVLDPHDSSAIKDAPGDE